MDPSFYTHLLGSNVSNLVLILALMKWVMRWTIQVPMIYHFVSSLSCREMVESRPLLLLYIL